MNSLTLDQIIAIADGSYADGRITLCYNRKTKRSTRDLHGDGLAHFIVQELCETFDPKADKNIQLKEAERVMKNAQSEIENVRAAFYYAHGGK